MEFGKGQLVSIISDRELRDSNSTKMITSLNFENFIYDPNWEISGGRKFRGIRTLDCSEVLISKNHNVPNVLRWE